MREKAPPDARGRASDSFGSLADHSEAEAEPLAGWEPLGAGCGWAAGAWRRLHASGPHGGLLLLFMVGVLAAVLYASIHGPDHLDGPFDAGAVAPSRHLPQTPGVRQPSSNLSATEPAANVTRVAPRAPVPAPLPVAPRTPEPTSAFELQRVGEAGRAACRGGESGQEDDPRSYVVATMVGSLEGCEDLCRATPGCAGVEYGDCRRCELWLDEITGTAEAEGFTCLRAPASEPTPLGRGPAPRGSGSGPLGEYGFLTEFDVEPFEARERVRQMARHFGVREFQFYDTMSSYSGPPAKAEEEWRTPCGGKLVRRSVLEAYADEVSAVGGRSWLYVQAMGTDPGDADAQSGFQTEGTHYCGDDPLLDKILPSAGWAKRVAERWAAFASSMGFGGLHWDTLGEGGDLPGFLRAAGPLLRDQGLAQSCNFVGGKSWDDSLASDEVVAFPYWEVWSVPDTFNKFIESSAHWNGGVLACYPGRSADHSGEMNNKMFDGVEPLDLLIGRWVLARNHSMAYLAIGDGLRRAGMEFLPASLALESWEVDKIQRAVFAPGEVERFGAAGDTVEAVSAGPAAGAVEGAAESGQVALGQLRKAQQVPPAQAA